jgi:magnesium/cobalt transport protein CorA
MELYHVIQGQVPARLDALEHMPEEGLIWIDFLRGQEESLDEWPRRLLGIEVDSEHILDVSSADHPSFFDGTEHYDMLIFAGLGPADSLPICTRVAAFLMFDRLLITVHQPDAPSFGVVKKRCQTTRTAVPGTVVGMTHLIIDTMVDRYLAIREPLAHRVDTLQDDLLERTRNNIGGDWKPLLECRRQLRDLETLCAAQLEALDAWRRNTRFTWAGPESVRIRDVVDHVTRVQRQSVALERDVESAVQLYFAAMSDRQNHVMQLFTVMSVVFMPLTVLTGVWGMNFENMPELKWKYGYPLALTSLVIVGVGIYVWFRRRKYL